jgi:hypothetical protein
MADCKSTSHVLLLQDVLMDCDYTFSSPRHGFVVAFVDSMLQGIDAICVWQ